LKKPLSLSLSPLLRRGERGDISRGGVFYREATHTGFRRAVGKNPGSLSSVM